MKIALLQDRLRLGGTESQALALGNLWAEAGHEVRLITFRAGGVLADSYEAEHLAPIVLQPFDIGLDGWAPGLARKVSAFGPDVVVAFGREANAKLLKLRNVKSRPALVATLRSGRAQPGRFWQALQGAHAVVVNSRWSGEAALAEGVAKDKIHLLYSGLARSPLVTDPAAARAVWRKRNHTPEDTVVFLYLAAFRQGKGQEYLINLLPKMPSSPAWQVWFAGEGVCLPECEMLAAKLRLHDRVRFLGRVDNPAAAYAAADVAVMTSAAEALPNFLLEAQAAGLPIVATSVGGVAECFEHPLTGLAVAPNDPEGFIQAMTKALTDAEWRANARGPAQARAADLFESERNAARWLDLFASLRR